MQPGNDCIFKRFLLTHPVWDVTWYGRSFPFYIRISTHTSRVGCDSIILMLLSPEKGFLLTHPVWDVTIHGRWAEICNRISTHTSRVGCDKRFLHFFSCLNISTHTSRVGCDLSWTLVPAPILDFYSHIPCGM